MFNNANMTEKLTEVGMDKQTAFRCTFNFLFKENVATLKITEPFCQTMIRHNISSHTNNVSLMIRICIRVGDVSFYPEEDALIPPSVYTRPISYAQKIEQAHRNSTKGKYAPLPWYVTVDSSHVRKMIAEHYKHKVIIDAKTAYFHGDCADKTYGGCNEKHLRHAITHAASQLKLFSLCYVHIIADSGWEFLSKPPYQVYYVTENDDNYRKIDRDEVMNIGAGI